MTSLDESASALWITTKPPLGLLGAIGCMRAATAGLSPEDRAPFDALSSALVSWWPGKKRSPRDLADKELAACMALYGRAARTEPLELPMLASYHEMAAMMLLEPSNLRLHELGMQESLGAESFAKLVRALAKHTHTDLELWKGRIEYLLAGTTDTWPTLVEKASRMGFSRSMRQVGKLPKPLKELARLSDLGGSASWSAMGTKHALLLQLGTTKRTAMLDDEQRALLVAALPELASAPQA